MTLREDQHADFQYIYSSKPVYYQCPLIAGYHDVIRINSDLEKYGARLFHPIIPIFDPAQTQQKLYEYMLTFFPDTAKKV